MIFYDVYKKYINESDDIKSNLISLYELVNKDIKSIKKYLYIDILKYPTISNCIQSIIQKIIYANMSIDFKPITINEYNLIESTAKGGLRFSKPGLYTNVYSYDIRDAYFSILRKKGFYIPVKPPREEYISYNNLLKDIDCKTLKYGIYNIKLINNGQCFFVFNKI